MSPATICIKPQPLFKPACGEGAVRPRGRQSTDIAQLSPKPRARDNSLIDKPMNH